MKFFSEAELAGAIAQSQLRLAVDENVRLTALLAERDAEIARLRAALAYYAEPREYNRVGGDPVGAEPPIIWDRGTRARAALAGGEG